MRDWSLEPIPQTQGKQQLRAPVCGDVARRSPECVVLVPPVVIYFNEVEKGGHFAAWEQPQLFVDELRAAYKEVQ